MVAVGQGGLTAKTNQKADELQISNNTLKESPLLSSSGYLKKKKGHLPKRIPLVTQPTTSSYVQCTNLDVPIQSSLKQDAAFITLDQDKGPGHGGGDRQTDRQM